MADDDTPTPSDPATVKVGKKQVKNEHVLIIIGVITLLVTILFMRKNAAASAAQQSSGTTAVTSAQDPSTSDGGYGTTSYADNPTYDADFQQMASDLQQMQSEITGLASPSISSTPISTTTTGGDTTTVDALSTPNGTNPGGLNQPVTNPTVAQGSGYWNGPTGSVVTDASGGVYDLLTSWTQAQQFGAEGVPVDYESAPGVFSPAFGTNGQLVPQIQQGAGTAATPLFTVA